MPDNKTTHAEQPKENFFYDTANEKPIYQPDLKTSEKIGLLYRRFQDMRDAPSRTTIEEEWKAADDAYYSAVEALPEDDERTNLNINPSFAIVETLNQETIERNARPFFEPFEKSDKALVNLINDVARSSYEIGNFDREWTMMKKERDIRGTGILMEFYREERRWVEDLDIVRDDKTGDYVEKYTKREIIDWDDVYSMWRPVHEFYFDPSALHIDHCKDMFWREVIHINEFRRRYGKRRGFKDVDFVTSGNSQHASTESTFEVPQDLQGTNDVEILHYTNISTDSYDVVVNGVLVREGPIPSPHKQLPVAVFYCYKPHNRFYGMGIPKVVEQEAAEITTNRNLRLDYVKRAIQKMFFIDDQADVDEFDLMPRAHGLVPVNTNGKPIQQVIAPMEYGDVKVSSYQDEQLLFDDVRRRTGIDDRVQGLNVGGTATEAAILKEAAQKRINAISIFSEMDGLKRLGMLRWSNIVFFYSVPKIRRIVDENGEVTIKAAPRVINIKGHQYTLDEGGNLVMQQTDGVSALELNKKMMKFLETNVNVTVDVQAGTQISKVVRQAKITEMFDRMVLPQVVGAVDIKKAVKRYIEINDEKPDDWLPEKDIEEDEVDMHEQAEWEFQAMLDGLTLPPTPNANQDHVVHELALTKSTDFQNAPLAIQQKIEEHIAGEDAQLRGAGGPQGAPGMPGAAPAITGGPQVSVGQGGAVQDTSAALPRPNDNPVDITPTNVPQ